MAKTAGGKLENLVLLRGLAVLVVCLCHFAKPLTTGFSYSGIFREINEYGRYGVEMFFVISGFVIPLSLDKGKYRITDYFVFLFKRLIRLHPAFLVAIGITLAICYLSFKVNHEPFPETVDSVTGTVFFYHDMAFNRVFWTLYIEAQYYFFIGLFFTLLKKYINLSLLVVIPLLLIAGEFPAIANTILLFKHLDFFFIGTVGYLIYMEHGHRILNYIVLGCLIIFSFFFCGIPNSINTVSAAFASLFTISMILFYKGPVPRIPNFLGKISYSLYLIHFPVGTKFVRLFMKIINPAYAWILFFLAFTVTIPVAWLLNKYIEEPSENLSRKIKYKSHLKETPAA